MYVPTATMTVLDRIKTLRFETKLLPSRKPDVGPSCGLYRDLGGAESTTESSGKNKSYDWERAPNGQVLTSPDAHASSGEASQQPLLKIVNITLKTDARAFKNLIHQRIVKIVLLNLEVNFINL